MSDKKEEPRKKPQETEFPLAEYRLVPVEEFEEPDSKKDTVNLVVLSKTIWKNREKIFKIVAIFIILGVLVALFSPKEYKTQATLMPELASQGNSSGAASLLQKYGGLVGLNTSNLSLNSLSTINVTLYPNIIHSTPFMLELMNQKIHSERYDTTVSIFSYFKDFNKPSIISYLFKYTIELPGLIKQLFMGKGKRKSIKINNGLIYLTKGQERVIKNLSGRISIHVDNRSGIIAITSEMPEAGMSAIMTNKTIKLLKSYVTDYRTQKAKQDYNFIKGQYEHAKKRFEQVQDTLANFQDRNINLATSQAQIQLKRLQNKYNLVFNLYDNLAQQLEQARIQVLQNTPVFKVLEPATVPLSRSSPKRILIVIISVLLGVATGIGFIFMQQAYSKVKQTWYLTK